jgi:hypothetical protein
LVGVGLVFFPLNFLSLATLAFDLVGGVILFYSNLFQRNYGLRFITL